MISQNEYFEGNVKSLGSQDATGDYTVGIINPGEYTFGTSSNERMELVRGTWDIQLPAGEGEWVTYESGTAFEIPAGTSFTVKVAEAVAYVCSYS